MSENESIEVAVLDQKYELSVQDVKTQVGKIQELMNAVMKKDEHYGVIPGTQKPTLLKSGSEKLGFIFRLTPKYDIKRTDLDNGHREYEVVCSLYHIRSGAFVGQGVGSCSTMESKYRYRTEGNEEPIGKSVPHEYWKSRDQSLLGGKGFRARKIDGQWQIVKIVGGEKVENPDIADVYNTVLKMAKKRAHVDAMLTACAASDIFTQDEEDFEPTGNGAEERKAERGKPRPTQQQTPRPPRETPAKSGNITERLCAIIDQEEYFSKTEAMKAKQRMHKVGTYEEREAIVREYEDLLRAKKGGADDEVPPIDDSQEAEEPDGLF